MLLVNAVYYQKISPGKVENLGEIYINHIITHRCDSIKGTDYTANPFFLSLGVSRTNVSLTTYVNIFFLKFLDQRCHKFSKGYEINVFTNLSS